jgi:hypothetical protein
MIIYTIIYLYIYIPYIFHQWSSNIISISMFRWFYPKKYPMGNPVFHLSSSPFFKETPHRWTEVEEHAASQHRGLSREFRGWQRALVHLHGVLWARTPAVRAVGEQKVDLPGLVNIQKANWKITIYSDFSYEKWWFPIVIYVSLPEGNGFMVDISM